ncbi:MAG: hypothetical protein KGH86_06385 [Thaumarchaeota archaeon]|nr:hypothetical protein [Nitrososphaerota archaeon]MDE1817489.1 hypothetical protein [Nitrososphaerota archaeon]MDE1876437.1 hypothetical protein [Nitrososphaerota archaeon]
MGDREPDPFSTYQENKHLLNSIFMKEKMSKYSKQLIDRYFKSLLRIHKKAEFARDPLEIGMIQDIVSDYLKDMQWHVKNDVANSDFDPHYRFDLVARKEKRTIVVLILPEITRQAILEIQKDVFGVKKEMPSTRVLVATDIQELPYILEKDTLSDMIIDMAKKYKLGMLLVDKNLDYQETCLVPSEFLYA